MKKIILSVLLLSVSFGFLFAQDEEQQKGFKKAKSFYRWFCYYVILFRWDYPGSKPDLWLQAHELAGRRSRL